jgi:hypothetical protein
MVISLEFFLRNTYSWALAGQAQISLISCSILIKKQRFLCSNEKLGRLVFWEPPSQNHVNKQINRRKPKPKVPKPYN